mmetsp:Transcript_138762/g.241296  ORF Transcript_138762/g.241296 Transcript_138762/m.241296 type:complete len:134 (+) Transcript_138762:682-1083(+)
MRISTEISYCPRCKVPTMPHLRADLSNSNQIYEHCMCTCTRKIKSRIKVIVLTASIRPSHITCPLFLPTTSLDANHVLGREVYLSIFVLWVCFSGQRGRCVCLAILTSMSVQPWLAAQLSRSLISEWLYCLDA